MDRTAPTLGPLLPTALPRSALRPPAAPLLPVSVTSEADGAAPRNRGADGAPAGPAERFARLLQQSRDAARLEPGSDAAAGRAAVGARDGARERAAAPAASRDTEASRSASERASSAAERTADGAPEPGSARAVQRRQASTTPARAGAANRPGTSPTATDARGSGADAASAATAPASGAEPAAEAESVGTPRSARAPRAADGGPDPAAPQASASTLPPDAPRNGPGSATPAVDATAFAASAAIAAAGDPFGATARPAGPGEPLAAIAAGADGSATPGVTPTEAASAGEVSGARRSASRGDPPGLAEALDGAGRPTPAAGTGRTAGDPAPAVRRGAADAAERQAIPGTESIVAMGFPGEAAIAGSATAPEAFTLRVAATGGPAATAAAGAPLSAEAPGAVDPRGDASVAATDAASLDAPVDTPEFTPALAAQVTLWAREGVQRAELRLNPAEMGPLSVQIVVDGTQAHVEFAAESATTRQTIETGLPTLASALRDAGLTLAGGGVFQQPRDTQGDRRGGNDRDTGIARGLRVELGGTPTPAEAPRARPGSSGHRLDVYA